MNRKLIHRLADRLPAVLGLAATLAITSARAHDAEPIEFSEIGIPYAWGIELGASEETHIEAGHVGAWSWDEDGFPATARGWTHTSTWVKVDLTEPAEFTVVLASKTNVAWPSVDDPTRLAGTNLFPSFTLYRGWDTDAGTPVDQDHTFNNRGNIEWAEDVTYLDHLDNSTAHSATRTWVLPAGRYTLNLGGNSPAVIAEGRQGYTATFSTRPTSLAITNGSLTSIEFSEVGIPYGLGVVLNDTASVQAPDSHVGAWSWDEDGFPATARGWTHTSTWVKVDLTEPAEFTVVLASQTNVAWPSVDDPARLAGTNLFPSFTLYRGWDTDAGTPVDQDHTFNNRGNIEWAEDVTYLDHLDNSTAHSATRTWVLPAGRYTLNLGGNSPAVIAEGRQGYTATFSTRPTSLAITNGSLTSIEFSEVGIPYGLGVVLNDNASVQAPDSHVGAWSWDEDGFPATARGWTHTSTWVKVDLTEPAEFTVVLASQTNVAWPSVDDPTRLAGTNLFPSFTLYRGWDTDAGTPIDQDHTFNNRGNIEWAEDVTYLDHLDNSTSHSATRTWVLPAGRYTLNLGGNSPAVIAEGRQGYTATFLTTPVPIASVAAGTGSVVVTWSGSIVGRRLHEAASPEGPWTPVNGEPSIVHSRRQQTLEAAGAARFFKLLP